MLNINRGHNQVLMEKCRRLWEYSEFIAEVNDNLAKGYPLKRAIAVAMSNCIERGVLADEVEEDLDTVKAIMLKFCDSDMRQ